MGMARIALVGMMGSGKSTVGRSLAERLGCPFVDLDAAIEAESGVSIPRIFATGGEAAFRAWEERVLRELTGTSQDMVLATGGGVVVTPGCRDLLRGQWRTVWLFAGVDTLVERLQPEMQARPMLQTGEPLAQRVRALIAARQAWYEAVAEWTVSVDGRSVEEIVRELAVRFAGASADAEDAGR
jgi:shikimate kinase